MVKNLMNERLSYLIQICGLVQGVGMRPFVYKTAKTQNLTGFVKNKGSSVSIAVSGEKQEIDQFLFELTHNLPFNAKINDLKITPIAKLDFEDFKITSSSEDKTSNGFILPDIAVCNECLNDIRNSQGSRFEYAFTNCTNCGPRYSIINDLPYDRINTSMNSFSMCKQCNEEYKNPENRRFHAQPNCCPTCGPQYYLLNSKGAPIECKSPIEHTKQLLKEGNIIAIKGIGGYHLVCNAQDKNAIETLRKRKNRPHKPFAIMASNIDEVRYICKLSSYEEDTITNNKRPIVLLNKKVHKTLPESIAPGLNQYGVMLPYSPLHYFIFDDALKYLVMTSGNISGMPICYKDEDAFKHLNKVVDYFLVHDREIMTPIDDSVVKVLDKDVLISRCGRGYAPTALPLNTSFEVLSFGGNQKSSVCFIHKGAAHISQYLGELNNLDACNEYIQVIKRLSRLLKANPKFVVHDLHPNFFSTQYANKLGKESIIVQHHHAHMAGCMAEHGLTDDAIGIIFDGTGMGTDGTVWGGEFLVGNRAEFQRVGHLEYVILQGADSAIKEPWKCAAAYLYTVNENLASFLPNIENLQMETVEKALQNKINCYKSSSMGRFFDCIAAIVLRRTHISYDAQAAIELESIVDATITDYYDFSIDESDKDGSFILGYKGILTGVLVDLKKCLPISLISAKFHNTICKATIACATSIKEKYKIDDVVLSGGVFENSYLMKNITLGLKESGFHVFFNKKVPLNDGGLSFGQAAAAVSILEEGAYVSGNSYKDNFNTGELRLRRNYGN